MTAIVSPDEERRLDERYGGWNWRDALTTAEPAHCPGWCDGGHDTEGAFGNLITDDEVTHHCTTVAEVGDFTVQLYLSEAHSSWNQEPVVDLDVSASGNCLAGSMNSRHLEQLAAVPGISPDLVEAVALAKKRLAELSVEV